MSKSRNYKDLTGQRFGRLICIKDIGRNRFNEAIWECICDCGNTTNVDSSKLRKGNTRSCGCLQRERARESNFTHGLQFDKDGKTNRIYGIWRRMKQRCEDVNSSDYSRYGGRGIKVCDEWLEFLPFYNWAIENGYRDNLSIDRISNEGDYEPSNSRWATRKEQNNNKRNNHLITYNNETKTLTQWAEQIGIAQPTLRRRLKYGWSVERALTEPVRGN
jgi:hypothetical protein